MMNLSCFVQTAKSNIQKCEKIVDFYSGQICLRLKNLTFKSCFFIQLVGGISVPRELFKK